VLGKVVRAERGWLLPTLAFAAVFACAWLYIDRNLSLGDIPDFTAFYAAGANGPIYDAHWLSSIQPGIWTGDPITSLRPFAYPPTLLLLLRPLHQLPYPFAYSLWVASTAVVFLIGARRLSPRVWWLAALSVPFAITARTGQTPLLIGGLVAIALTSLSRPLLAGALLGAAFSLKPQVILLAPIALMLAGHWRALGAMAITGLAMCAASLVLGPHLWIDWLRSLQEFSAINSQMGVEFLAAPPGLVPLYGVIAVMCLTMAVKRDPATILIAIVGGSVVISPHAVSYELTMLVPASLAFIWPIGLMSVPALWTLITLSVPPWAVLGYVVLASCRHRIPVRPGLARWLRPESVPAN
jgi:hypothetical protein